MRRFAGRLYLEAHLGQAIAVVVSVVADVVPEEASEAVDEFFIHYKIFL